jgi:hypothetical protein
MGLVSRSADGFVLAGALRAELAALPRLAWLACRLNVVAAVGAAVAAGNDPVGRHGVDGDWPRARWRCQSARGSGAVTERVDQPPPATGSVLAATPGVAVGAAPSDAHRGGLMAKVGSCMAGSSRAGGMQGTYTHQQVVSTLVAADPAALHRELPVAPLQHVALADGLPPCARAVRARTQPVLGAARFTRAEAVLAHLTPPFRAAAPLPAAPANPPAGGSPWPPPDTARGRSDRTASRTPRPGRTGPGWPSGRPAVR